MSAGWLFVGVALAGGAGAALRYLVDGLVSAATRTALPLGTAVVNVTGSAALGIVTGALAAGALGGGPALVLGGGLLGGYTTFSTASLEALDLLRAGRATAAAALVAGTLLCSLAVAWGGFALGAWLGGA